MKENKVWEILEIEKTDDVEAIRNAYRAKLVNTNPEDDPEGFMELKEAYDTALQIAEGDDKKEERPYADIIAQVDDIYKDINKRTDILCWKKLFENPIFTSLDDQDGIRREFLAYTMDHYKYPGEVLRIFDNLFTIIQDREALCEVFPADFISFLCDNIENGGDYVLAEKPVPGKENGITDIISIPIESTGETGRETEFEYDIDDYIATLNRLLTCYRRIDNTKLSDEEKASETESLGALILSLRKFDYYHPFEEIAVIRYLFYKEQFSECFRLLQNAVDRTVMADESHSDFYYSHLLFMYLRFFVQDSLRDMGLSITPEVLEKCGAKIPKVMDEIYVNDTHAAMSLYWYLKGNKKRAAEYMSYTADYLRDTAYIAFSDQIDSERMTELPGMIEADPDNLSYKISLAWIYSRKDRMDEAIALLESVPEELRDDMEYCNIRSRILINRGDFKDSIPYLIKWNEKLYENFGYDKSLNINDLPIEDVRQINRVPYSFYLLGAAYANTDDLTKAKEYMMKALEGASMRDYYEYTELYNYILTSNKEYDEGLMFWTGEVEKDNQYIAICHGNRQYMAHKAHDVRTVIEDYFYLREKDPLYSDSYLFAEDVYIEYSDMEGFETVLKYLEHYNIHDVRLDYNMGRYLRINKKYKEAIDVFNSVEAAIKDGYEGIEDPFRFYISYGYTLMDYDRTGLSDEEHDSVVSKIKELSETSIGLSPDNIRIHWLQIDCFENYEPDKAEPAYKEMLRIFPDDGTVNYEYGRYLDNNDREAEAGPQYEIGLEKEPEHVDLRYRLSDYYNDYRYKELEEEEYNKKAIEISDKILELRYDSRAAVNYALLLIDGMDYAAARTFCDKAVTDFPDAAYVHNARGLCYMYLGEYEEAEKSFLKAIEVYDGTAKFISYSNLVKLYRKQCRFDKAVDIYLKYMERFEVDDISTNEKMADIYDDAGNFEKAFYYRIRSYNQKLSKTTGREEDLDAPINLCKTVQDNKDISPDEFGGLSYYLRRMLDTLSYADKLDEIYRLEEDFKSYLDMIDFSGDTGEMTDKCRENLQYAFWAAAYHFTFTRRSPEDAIKYFKKYIILRKKTEGDEKNYYEDVYEAYDLLGRCCMYLGDRENAAHYAEKAIECINLGYGSVEKYLSHRRLFPLRACRISGIELFKGNKAEAMRLLGMTDTCLKCYHCAHDTCADKIDRLALISELEGDYEKAIEYYELGIKLGGNDVERTSGIRECRRKLEATKA